MNVYFWSLPDLFFVDMNIALALLLSGYGDNGGAF